MAGRSFIDTNVLVYAEASDAPLKQRAALTLLKRLYDDKEGVISTQVLQAYCNVALKKLRLEPAYIRAQLDLFAQFEVVQVTPAIIRAGLDLQQIRKLAFFDSMVLASAHAAGCNVIWSEDMNTGEVINGMTISNPFIGAQSMGG